mmetsp:Transcript_121488/g.388643  ORF Transcript_121488/g.388643 Transcript_121488/m.388643 type:complete len:555 (-) Transcript_121488:110-1774(-)
MPELKIVAMPPAQQAKLGLPSARPSERIKGQRHWRRRMPSRLAAMAWASVLWIFLIWWVLGGSVRCGAWLGCAKRSWYQAVLLLSVIPVFRIKAMPLIDRAMGTVPRLLYTLRVDHWKLLTVDAVSRPLAGFAAVASTLVLLNMALRLVPKQAHIMVPKPVSADDDEQLRLISAATVADLVCPLTRRTLKALFCSTLAWIALVLRDPPKVVGSRCFRLYPILRRSGLVAPSAASAAGSASRQLNVEGLLSAAPELRLLRGAEEIPMPVPTVGSDGIPVWTFDRDVIISEYTWLTALAAPPEDDPVLWRLEGSGLEDGPAAAAVVGGQHRWHAVSETDTSWAEVVPLDRGAVLARRFIAPDGEVPATDQSWLGVYYRALQHPEEDRDSFAVALLIRKMMLPVVFLIGLLPWLNVFGIELKSVVGLTSVGGMAAGVALSLAKSEVLENVFAGVLLSAQGHVINGDDVEINIQVANAVSSVSGTVCNIGSAYVSVLDKDRHMVQVPNRLVLGSIVRHAQPVRAEASPAAAEARLAHGHALNYLSRMASAELIDANGR